MGPKATVNTSDSDCQAAPATHRCMAAKTVPEPSYMPENRPNRQPSTTDSHRDDNPRSVSLGTVACHTPPLLWHQFG